MPSPDFAQRLLKWFDSHGRKDLPWQQQPTPYRVWVSEIMLQQTQVQTVIPYYQRFMQRFPTLQALAGASLDEVLHHWSGLGYYARARNLHKAARQIRDESGGCLPELLEDLVQLPGIGRSTAGAILSLACGQHHAILDGNVKRVLARYHALEGWPGKTAILKQLWSLSEAVTPTRRVGDYNQSIMDLGATVCVRGRPVCERCPLQAACKAFQQGRQQALPSPRPRRDLPVRAVQMLLLVSPGQEVFLEKRPATGIWGGLWSFPEFTDRGALQNWCDQNNIPSGAETEIWPVVRHTFSHFHLDITPCCIKLQNPVGSVMEADRGVWYNALNCGALGLAAPVQRLLTRLQKSNRGEDRYGSYGAVCETG
ncbi:MAG: A/G-specific adenine glycosylase [Thiogranum sp.]